MQSKTDEINVLTQLVSFSKLDWQTCNISVLLEIYPIHFPVQFVVCCCTLNKTRYCEEYLFDKLAHTQVVINWQVTVAPSVHQWRFCLPFFRCVIFDDVMSYNSLTTSITPSRKFIGDFQIFLDARVKKLWYQLAHNKLVWYLNGILIRTEMSSFATVLYFLVVDSQSEFKLVQIWNVSGVEMVSFRISTVFLSAWYNPVKHSTLDVQLSVPLCNRETVFFLQCTVR